MAIGTSAAAVAVNAVTGLAGQARAGRVKWPCATVFALAGLAGALIGAHLAQAVSGEALLRWFAFAMIAIAVSMLIPRKNQGDPGVRITWPIVARLAPLGLAAGLVRLVPEGVREHRRGRRESRETQRGGARAARQRKSRREGDRRGADTVASSGAVATGASQTSPSPVPWGSVEAPLTRRASWTPPPWRRSWPPWP